MSIRIRPYEAGDAEAQVAVYNTAARRLPSFKPANADEVNRRANERAADPGPPSSYYAVDESTGSVIGYAVFNPDGRVSYPWCLPGDEAGRGPLLDAVLAAMSARGLREAWAAYRADWSDVIAFFRDRGFALAREIINYVAETSSLPDSPLPHSLAAAPLDRGDLTELLRLGRGLFGQNDVHRLGEYFWENPYFGPGSLFALRDEAGQGAVVGAAIVIASTAYAEPIKVDAAMPCFRLGALGSERQRHKRVNGMMSCVFAEESVCEALLAESARRIMAAGLPYAAAQASSDRADLVALYDRFFRRQGAFPILSIALPIESGRR